MVGVEWKSRREWTWALVAAACIVALASLPYLLAWLITPAGYHFTGLLINPLDGHSYLAKMGQGAAGEWLFRLPYTSEPHAPVFIFTYFLALGHLAPAGSPVALLVIYHLARIFFGFTLMMAVYGAAAFLTPDIRQRRLSLLFVGLTSGFGWLSGSAPDLTVPEAITFPSILVNAHFGLTALLMLSLILGITLASSRRAWWAVVALASACLTMIQPYAVLTVGLAAAAWVAIRWFQEHRPPWLPLGRLVLFGFVSLPFLLYFLWMTRSNPQIGRWMAQNITPSPPVWQWLVAYGLLGPLALVGAWRAAQRRTPADWLLLCWAGGQIGLMLLPIALQRRLSTGLHLPLAFLAVIGWREVVAPLFSARRAKLLTVALFLVAFPSNLLFMLAGVHAVSVHDPHVVLPDAQWEAMAWLRENVPPETVVLADEQLGAMVPAWGGGARVVYGHPFETLDVERVRAAVNDFYAGDMPDEQRATFLDRYGVQVIIVQGEKLSLPPAFHPVWQFDSITIYRAEGS